MSSAEPLAPRGEALDRPARRAVLTIKAVTVGPTGVRGTRATMATRGPLLVAMMVSDVGRPGEFRWTANPPDN